MLRFSFIGAVPANYPTPLDKEVTLLRTTISINKGSATNGPEFRGNGRNQIMVHSKLEQH
ncbi:hypothetical protein NSE_0139 [Neorickettsia sennetsu str. Miyayama]|uniref:Uncharacterized protein n=1 Tax=Ehrlichia sennetsu (strain ATCC VR-367 / Miyayama) TaxID=222891 RepID=Q2GEQ8_EHRS3|nr:hypothetical protein NSE_0139 [Neorickettsia sennetsu str. Miyayama]